MPGNLFDIGLYKRSDLHDRYGGNRQGGISTSASHPHIFIFSGSTGQQHGYKDQWENSYIFSYTGEGQVGDMRFIKGNLALRDHVMNGRRVFLFVYERKGFVRFEAELKLLDYDFFIGTDRDGNARVAIKFFFKEVSAMVEYPIERTKLITNPNFNSVQQIDEPKETERVGLTTTRVGQGAYRKSILFRWNFKCAVTSYSGKDILIASHIVPWRHASDDERLDVHNGILLSPVYDALFDTHLISFENDGKIILSHALAKTNYKYLGVTGKEYIRDLTTENKFYLERHRCNLIDLR